MGSGFNSDDRLAVSFLSGDEDEQARIRKEVSGRYKALRSVFYLVWFVGTLLVFTFFNTLASELGEKWAPDVLGKAVMNLILLVICGVAVLWIRSETDPVYQLLSALKDRHPDLGILRDLREEDGFITKGSIKRFLKDCTRPL